MTKTTTARNRIAILTAAVFLAGTTGAWAAESQCGPIPNPPDIPDDGATATAEQMENALNELDLYTNKFAEFNTCAIKEYDASAKKWPATLEAYQNKGKNKETKEK
jgi:hypothetical protein